jgi:hypothetical protein
MAEKATILIPDISGFTEFTTITEIDHASHIIAELLELIVESNTMGFTLAEIEGDAVLLYLKGEAPAVQDLVNQCTSIFENFHSRLMVIERDTACQCGACQSTTNLTLKFIVHFGEIKEIKVGNFVKATGVDMIIAHRLMKNSIDSDEYILLTKPCIDCSKESLHANGVKWISSAQEYEAIGNVEYDYAILSDYKKQIPKPPKLKEFVIIQGDDNLEVEINKSIFDVCQTIVNVEERSNWIGGMDELKRDPVTERIGMGHNCLFMGMTLIMTCKHYEYSGDSATYVERVEAPEISFDTVVTYTLSQNNDNTTHVNYNMNWQETPMPDENKLGMLATVKANLETLKTYVESK